MTLHPLVDAELRAQRAAGWVERHQLGVDASRAQLASRPPRHGASRPCLVSNEEVPAEAGTNNTRVPIRRYQPLDGPEPESTFVFLHGGGWVLGDLELSDGFCRDLARKAGCEVVSIDYRLAPEHPFPAALDDAMWVMNDVYARNSREPNRPRSIAIGGISAGANLAAAAAIRLRDEDLPVPDLQVLICPVLDISCSSVSYREMATDRYLTAADMWWFWAQYTGQSNREVANHERGWCSPLHVPSASGLPRALVVNAEHDVLRDEGEQYAARLSDAGVDAVSATFGGMIHGFVSDERLPPARAAMSLIAQAVASLTRLQEGAK